MKVYFPGGEYTFCVYDEPSTDLCLHKDLYLANVHHRAVKRDGVQSILNRAGASCSIYSDEEGITWQHLTVL